MLPYPSIPQWLKSLSSFCLKVSTWKVWAMKPPNRAMRKLARFKNPFSGGITLGMTKSTSHKTGELPSSMKGEHRESISQLLSSLTAFTFCQLFVSSTSWLSGRGQVDAYLLIHSIHSVTIQTDLLSASSIPGTIPEVLGCCSGQNHVPDFLELKPMGPNINWCIRLT